jgi:methylmalonyl-CoA/ethylmalonyl-CoA epimerase
MNLSASGGGMDFPKLELHHVGIACKSIMEEENFFLPLGYIREGEIFTDPIQKVRGLFMTQGTTRMELLEPISIDSPINTFIQREIKMCHQAFFCQDLLKTTNFFWEQGAYIVVQPVTNLAFNGRKVSFLKLKNKMLIELIESPR